MASKLFFAGKLHTTPTVVSAVDDEAMSPRNAAAGNDLAILGPSDGGEPGKRLKFGSPLEAERVLLAGEGLEAVRDAFGPSAETGGPRTITFVRVGAPTRSSLTLKDGSAADAITLTASPHMAGLIGNQIKVKVDVGSDGGSTRRVTTQYGNRFYVQDNIKRVLLDVRYAGASTVGEVVVSNTSLTLRHGATSPGSNATVLLFDNFPTVQQLGDRINAEPDWQAVVDASAALLPTKNKMDGVTNGDAKIASPGIRLTGNLQAAIDWINSTGEGLVEAVRPAAATAIPAVVGFTYLTGGTYPAIVNQDWTDAIDELENADVQWIGICSSAPAHHAALAAHCDFMSGAGQKERRAVVGAPKGTDIDAVKALARSIASDRVAFAWPAKYAYDRQGNLVLLDGHRLACQIAGMFAGVNPGTALTNKTLHAIGVEYEARVPADTDGLIDNGVLVVAPSERGYRVVRSISTWLANDKFNRVEMSCGAAVDFTARSVRNALQVIPGGKASPRTMGRAAAITRSVLQDLSREEPVGPGILVGDATNPPYKNISVFIEGDRLGVSFQCSPVIPVNFVTVSLSLVPYEGRLTLGQ